MSLHEMSCWDKCWHPSVTFWPLGSLLVVVKVNTPGLGWPNLLYVFGARLVSSEGQLSQELDTID